MKNEKVSTVVAFSLIGDTLYQFVTAPCKHFNSLLIPP